MNNNVIINKNPELILINVDISYQNQAVAWKNAFHIIDHINRIQHNQHQLWVNDMELQSFFVIILKNYKTNNHFFPLFEKVWCL